MAAALREAYDIQVELATHATMVLILGLGQPPADLERFAHDFDEVVERIGRPGEAGGARAGAGRARERGRRAAARGVPRRRRRSSRWTTPSAASRAESIAGYPPGIPALLPGERITTEVVAYLRELKASGARLHGASDPEFRPSACWRS